MPRRKIAESQLRLPEIEAGDWKGEIFGISSVSFGQVVQNGPPRQSVEFTYMLLPALLVAPRTQFQWPAVVTVSAPTPMKPKSPDSGCLFQTATQELFLTLSLEVTRVQFSDMLRMLEACRMVDFHFTTEEAATEGTRPVRSWGIAIQVRPKP